MKKPDFPPMNAPGKQHWTNYEFWTPRKMNASSIIL